MKPEAHEMPLGAPLDAPTPTRRPAKRAPMRAATAATVPGRAGRSQSGQRVSPTFASKSRRWSWISVAVPTVERALVTRLRRSMAIAGGRFEMKSTSGRGSRSRNWRA